jgi:hypothetical protein
MLRQNAILDFSQQHGTSVEATGTKPAGIEAPGHPIMKPRRKCLISLALRHGSMFQRSLLLRLTNAFTVLPMAPCRAKAADIRSRVVRKEHYVEMEHSDA